MAGRFSRRVRAHAKAHQIPLKDCAPGERKHEIAEDYLPKDANFTGIFLILVARALRQCGMCNVPRVANHQPCQKVSLCESLLVSHSRSRLGTCHHQDERSSSIRGTDHLEWT